jgi:hypothetical protein
MGASSCATGYRKGNGRCRRSRAPSTTLRPSRKPRAGSTLEPIPLTTPALSNPGIRPPEAIVGGVPKADESAIPRRSPGWDRRVGYADANFVWGKRHGRAVFDRKHSFRFAEFVVDDFSHPRFVALTFGRRHRGRGGAKPVSWRPIRRLIGQGIAAPAAENPPHTATARRGWHPDTAPT